MSRLPSTVPTWPQFAAWLGCGLGIGAVLAGAFAYGVVGLPAAIGFTVLAVNLGGGNLSALGVVPGVGVWALVIGFLNSDGPGDVCRSSATEQSCTQQWSPWPFWTAGIIMIVLPPILVALARRRTLTALR